MTDLWVLTDAGEEWEIERPATSADVLAVALDLDGVEIVDWCETHRVELKVTYVEGYEGLRECQDSPYFAGDCRIIPIALFPIPETE